MGQLGSFQDPFPDELLFSALARTVSSGEADSKTLKRLVGVHTLRPATMIPIGRLLELLPVGSKYSDRYLLWHHTPAAFYFPFLGVDLSYLAVGNYLDRRLTGTLLVRKGIGGWVPFRMCPRCVEEDRSRYGQAIWRRSHHLLGVPACPTHRVPLHVATPQLQKRLRHSLLALEYALQEEPTSSWTEEPSFDDALTAFLCRWSKWLLEECDSLAGYANLILGYRARMRKLDMEGQASTNRQIESDCIAVWKTGGRRQSRQIERWFGGYFYGRHLYPADISPVNHLIVCRALGWTPEEALKWLPEAAIFQNPLRPSRDAGKGRTLGAPPYGLSGDILLPGAEFDPHRLIRRAASNHRPVRRLPFNLA